MRNGLYQSWFQGPKSQGSSAVILLDGRVISSDPGHAYLGHFTDENGCFRAKVRAKRHTALPMPAAMADLDEFTVHCEGPSTAETVTLRCTMPEEPGVTIEIKMLWIGEI